jgi:hypothetical protein
VAITISDLHFQERFKLVASAEWQPVDIPPSGDPQADPFAPLLAALVPVRYFPVRRRSGTFTFPQLRVHVELQEAELKRRNFDVPKLVGAEVKIDVSNVFEPPTASIPPVSLPSGHLDSKLVCDVTISATDVQKFLDRSGPMKASLNKNLFSFTVEIPAVQVEAKPLQGVSANRAYLYCKKSIAFLPGVFGSQFTVQRGKGVKDGFPDFLADDELRGAVGSELAALVIRGKIRSQRIGVLECDSHGEPILPAFNPKLLRLGGDVPVIGVYDTYTALREARVRKLNPVPDDFLVYDLCLFAYDWRGDLSEQAKKMMDRLRVLQGELQGRRDTDDQIAVAGHSTGGVIIRKMLGEPGADSLISHAFFLNTPFRGAPKALGVFLTGCDPPGGDPMLPIVNDKSLRNIASSAPIVYHLSPSFQYPHHVVDIPGGVPAKPDGKPDVEREKAALIDAALQRGIYFRRFPVETAPTTNAERVRITDGADDWSNFVDGAAVRKSGEPAYILGGVGVDNFKQIDQDERAKGDRPFQLSKRVPVGWNTELANKSLAFHQASEATAQSGAWKDKAFIFYSKFKAKPTTGSVVLSSLGQDVDCHSNVVALISPEGVIPDLIPGTAHPPEPQKANGALQVEQWDVDPVSRSAFKRFWQISTTTIDGDGTVPVPSLLGFGGPARVFTAIPQDPDHTHAPNSPFVWDRVLDVLQGDDFDGFLLKTANTTNGTES